MKLKQKLKLWRVKIYIIAKEFFHYSLFTYLLILIAETIKEGIVSYFFNINILLIVVVLSGFVMTITYDEKLSLPTSSHKKITYWNIIFSILLTLGGGLFIYAGTFELGTVAIIISCLTAFLIFLLSLMLLTDKE